MDKKSNKISSRKQKSKEQSEQITQDSATSIEGKEDRALNDEVTSINLYFHIHEDCVNVICLP